MRKYPFTEAVTPRLLELGDLVVVEQGDTLLRCRWGGEPLMGDLVTLRTGEYRVDEIVYVRQEDRTPARTFYVVRLGLVGSEVSRLVRLAPSKTVRRMTTPEIVRTHYVYPDEPVAVAAREFIGGCSEALMDMATAFSCGEAEQIARLLELVDGAASSQAFLLGHAAEDDEGDAHWDLANGRPRLGLTGVVR